MTETPPSLLHGIIVASLIELGCQVEALRTDLWSVQDQEFVYRIQRLADWLVIDHSLPAAPGFSASEVATSYLEGNDRLGGNVKFVRGVGSRPVHLRAEIPWIDDEFFDLAGHFQTAHRGVHQGLQWWQAVERSIPGPILEVPAANEPAVRPSQPDITRSDFIGLAEQAGWRVTARSDQKLVADLDVASEPTQAFIAMTSVGTARAWIELGNLPATSDCRVHAAAVHLLAMGDTLRLARPVIFPAEEKRIIGLAVDLPAFSLPAEIQHALAALSVAWDETARETRVLLADKAIATEYLTRQGMAPGFSK